MNCECRAPWLSARRVRHQNTKSSATLTSATSATNATGEDRLASETSSLQEEESEVDANSMGTQPRVYHPCDHPPFLCTMDEVCRCVENHAFCEKFCLCPKTCMSFRSFSVAHTYSSIEGFTFLTN